MIIKKMRRITSQPRGGFRQDLGQAFRSGWEANMARYWNYIKVPWKYEPREFEFTNIKRGNRYYKPDFYLSKTDRWVEIKGYLSPSDKTKLKRFKKYYPEEAEKLQFIIYDPYSRSVESGKVMAFLLDKMDKHLGFYFRKKYLDVDIISYKEIKNKLNGLIPNWER